jgi:hypothetical protein
MIRETTDFKEFRPFPVYHDRPAWEGLPEETKEYYLNRAGELRGREWPPLPAALYMEFFRNGNRSNYQSRYYRRREDLAVLMLAECIEGRGAYLDDVINGLWAICEESTWVIPAHLNHGRWAAEDSRELPDPEDPVFVDLFAAETASLLAWVYYFLGGPLAARAPRVKRRIELEVERRVLRPCLDQDYYWMGLDHDMPVNNWNPWINSNLLVAYLVFTKTFPAAARGAAKTIRGINRFIRFYAEDGGCDEGPSYFNKAGASLFDFIEALGQVTGVSYLYKEPKIRNIAAYIYKVYIGGTFYVNFADASPTVYVPAGVLERTGKESGDRTLRDFAAYLREHRYCRRDDMVEACGYSIYRLLAGIFSLPPGPGEQAPLNIPRVNYFEGIQVLTVREHEDRAEGFFFAAKGGHNNESHNHNDVGNFLLYRDGVPVLVDAGVETYTRFTFNEKRYTLWPMQSCFHSLPTINGADQAPGPDRRAAAVSYSEGEGLTKFSLDIAGAYPPEAGVRSYRREFVFRPGTGLSLTDTYALEKRSAAPLVLNFLCHEKPEPLPSGFLLSGLVRMDLEGPPFSAAVDEIPLTDEKMRRDWQDKKSLYRLRLNFDPPGSGGVISLRFQAAAPLKGGQ